MSHTSSLLLLVFLVVLTFLRGSLAQMFFPGPSCPSTLPLLTSFDPEQFLGVWYEIERTPSLVQFLKGTCWTIDYQDGGTDGYVAAISFLPAFAPTRVPFTQNAISFDPDVPGRVTVTVGQPSIPFLQKEYYILDTDYNNYALVWQCQDAVGGRTEMGWVLGRNPNLLPNFITLAKQKVAAPLSLQPSNFVRTVPSCPQ